MLQRILGNIIPTLDRLIERIPPHIRDLIQKAAIAFAALLALVVIISGVNKGLREAQPVGYKFIESNRDLFYLQEMREEYAKKRKLVEDIEVDPLEFPSRREQKTEPGFTSMGRDTLGHLMGEKDELLKSEDPLRPREKAPGYLGDSFTIPRLTPDKKTIEGDDMLTKEKIGQANTTKLDQQDVFSEKIQAAKSETQQNKNPEQPARSEKIPEPAPRPSSGKLEFLD
ncbi:MAG: hypothetical protein N2Z22_09915 [Turneriella sp.]|nr:hypothetical protein [Leptospiraceae bacterium]MCX7633633.1 hypothetical protein [Turneriella sp.]